MLDRLPRAVMTQARGFMILMGYIMAYVAFFIVLAEYGGTSPSLKALQWGLLLPPVVYVSAVAAENISRARGA